MSLFCCDRTFSSCAELGLLSSMAFLVAERGLCGAWASVVVAHKLSYSELHGIFLDQGSNPCLLYWQADSQALEYQESLRDFTLITIF